MTTALDTLKRPVNRLIRLGVAFAALGALVNLVPFIGLTELGRLLLAGSADSQTLHDRTRQEIARKFMSYADSEKRPYIHLIDGGLRGVERVAGGFAALAAGFQLAFGVALLGGLHLALMAGVGGAALGAGIVFATKLEKKEQHHEDEKA